MPNNPASLSFLTREPHTECENTATFQIVHSNLPGMVDYFILVVREDNTANSNEFRVPVAVGTLTTVTATFPKDNVQYDVDVYAVTGCNAHRRRSTSNVPLASNPTYVPGTVHNY